MPSKQDFYQNINNKLCEIKQNNLFKNEHLILSAQDTKISTQDSQSATVLNFCANNYLGLANNSTILKAAHDSIEIYGYGMASVRFICGTQNIHKELELALSNFLGFEDAILYGSCFDANGGLFETLLDESDAIISDELNHASIIDGIRLCKAKRFRYKNNNMQDLEQQLILASNQNARYKVIATDGVFSMDGIIANLRAICDLADKYNAIVMVDDSHATGFIGAKGRGTPELCGVEGRIDIMTSTLGKALGGASGGYTVAKKDIISLLRQKSRPYLFSNSLCPIITKTTLTALDIVQSSDELRIKLMQNQELLRKLLQDANFDIIPSSHPIVPIMLYDEQINIQFANRLMANGIFVVPFSYPVVPKNKARIRVQVSAIHTVADIEYFVQTMIDIKSQIKA